MTNTTTPATPDGLARCMLPPTGWACSRTRGHEGPCAARPLVEELARGMLRDELRRTNSGRDFAATWEDESEAWLLNADYAVKFLSTPLADNGLGSELERLRGDSDDSHLVAMRKMRARGHFIDQHFDAILAALTTKADAAGEGVEQALTWLRGQGSIYAGGVSVPRSALIAIADCIQRRLSRTPSQANDAAGQELPDDH